MNTTLATQQPKLRTETLADMPPNMARVEFICGTTFDRTGNPLDPRRLGVALARTEQLLLQEFGGFSRQTVEGGWVSPATNKTVRDEALVFSCLVPLDTRRSLLETLQGVFKDLFMQESVPFSVTLCHSQF